MNFIRNLSIRNKLVLIIFAINFLTLSISSTIIILINISNLKKEVINSVRKDARLFGELCALPLDFGYPERANEILVKLQSLPYIQFGKVYDNKGKLFASYNKEEKDSGKVFLPEYSTFWFDGDYLYVFERIYYQEKYYGTIFLKADTDISKTTINNITVIVLVTISILLLSFLLTKIFERVISNPILNLAKIAAHVSEKGDFTLRVHKNSKDEIGILYDKFNYMLETIHNREKERDKAIEALEEMVYIASHDLQSPLLSISGFSREMLESYEDKLDDDGKYCLTRLNENAQRMHKLVISLLDISRLNTRKPENQELDLNNILDSIIQDLALSIEKNNVLINYDLLPVIWGDKTRIEGVIRNLIVNAINYGGKIINIRFNDNTLQVQDNGIGIPKEQLEKIFKPGERLKMIKADGVGMGLTFCKKVVEQHQAKIWAESEGVNHGATFFIKFSPQSIKS